MLAATVRRPPIRVGAPRRQGAVASPPRVVVRRWDRTVPRRAYTGVSGGRAAAPFRVVAVVEHEQAAGSGLAGEVRLGVVDEHAAYRDGAEVWLGHASAGRVCVVAAAASVPGLLAFGAPPPVVLLDPCLADGSDPAENVRTLTRLGAAVVGHGCAEPADVILHLLEAGAIGYVRKSAPLPDLLAAVTAAARREPYLEPVLAYAAVVSSARSGPRLSSREVEVLQAVGSGSTRTAVARLLGIGEGTVKTHLDRIRRKYADAGRPARTPLELYQRGVEDGWIAGPATAGRALRPSAPRGPGR